MSDTLLNLKAEIIDNCPDQIHSAYVANDELTCVVKSSEILKICLTLRDVCGFEQLIDLCGVDYSAYGCVEWETTQATQDGFCRAVSDQPNEATHEGERYAVVYHLLSIEHNVRVRLKAYLPEKQPMIESVASAWSTAEWFEREAFDLFGIRFTDHPDLRRILTDYGFVGYPLRKDFPISGHVEMRYDEVAGRVVYEPVEIEPRILVPRVIRHDNRYVEEATSPEAE